MYVCSKEITHEEAIALGCDPNLRSNYRSRPDGLVEVDMKGNVIWEWNISDHVIQDVNPDVANYVGKGKKIADYPQKFDANFGAGRRGDWIHTNSFDYNEVLDQVVINNSWGNEFYVVDHGGTFVPGDPKKSIELAASDAGDFLFRWGNPVNYDAGDPPSVKHDGETISHGHKQLFFTHDIQWIREKEVMPMKWELPGAGNFLIFDNGGRRLDTSYSSVIEINPYKGDWRKGVYVPEAEAGYAPTRGKAPQQISRQITWSFKSTTPHSFYGSYISGCQRLPNGNTFIASGPQGHFFEVTKAGEVVWEYINPVGDRTGDKYGIYKIMSDEVGEEFNATFRAHRYPADYAGLTGRDLKPLGKITEIHSVNPSMEPVRPQGPYTAGKGSDPRVYDASKPPAKGKGAKGKGPKGKGPKKGK
ncbi:aryl-sulfate sulfotransferase [Thermodesulfobacteriota bacterium]